MELEQPSGDSAAVEETALPAKSEADFSIFNNDPPEGDSTERVEAPPEDEDEEEELEGVKLRGKKEALEKFKAERLMQADYTRKTQEVAEHRKAVEAERAQLQQHAQAQQQYLEEVADLRMVDRRLSQFSQVNWNALTEQDPVQALKLHTEFTQLQAHKGQLMNALTQKQQQAQHMQQRETAKQLMEARQVLERDIKGWSPELAGKLMDFGVKQGFPPEAMNNITQPAIVKMLHKAYLFDQLEKQRSVKPPVAPAPPVSRLTGSSAATTKPLSEVSDAEYIRRRREYQSKNR